MSQPLEADILAILAEGRDLTLATVGADGAPHAVVVSYASGGPTIYFGCSPDSQKARNLAADDRVALTVSLPYRDWGEIRGLSISGRARQVPAGEAQDEVALLFTRKFSEIAQYVAGAGDADLALFAITPEVIGVLDYRQGFGHVEHVRVLGLRPLRLARMAAEAVSGAGR
ncbi:pyridoxamine 5'-phosphate oxidase family protein [uncultured Phenylobacterium sp.]|uniref:pyridoxamine 5'-phosphate oxidase family protein n=1 Tax=uncultured Phenylobacterium sp. TaxID=349273 RepID=UPI0025D9027A|nr:pyridoxamine 5'-phosphate oxidase family protein [uncultured Phenylobacterium sp.]